MKPLALASAVAATLACTAALATPSPVVPDRLPAISAEEVRPGFAEPASAVSTIEIYERPGFAGTMLRLNNDIADLGPTPMGDDASSLKIHGGQWEVCSHRRYEGRCEVLPPGDYPNLRRRVESIRRVG